VGRLREHVRVGTSAIGLHPDFRDVLLSLFLFLGPPAAGWVIRVCVELHRSQLELRQWRTSAKSVSEEGYPPGPPVASAEQTPE